jgi:hypothetical protein
MGFERAGLVWLVGFDVERTIQGGKMKGRVRRRVEDDQEGRRWPGPTVKRCDTSSYRSAG